MLPLIQANRVVKRKKLEHLTKKTDRERWEMQMFSSGLKITEDDDDSSKYSVLPIVLQIVSCLNVYAMNS